MSLQNVEAPASAGTDTRAQIVSLNGPLNNENQAFKQAVSWLQRRFPMSEQRARVTAELAKLGGRQ